MAKLKQLKQHEEIFYPVTVGQAVIFEDSTNAAITESQMNEIFEWNRDSVVFTPTVNNTNFLEVRLDPSTAEEYYEQY